MTTLAALTTPCLLLEDEKLQANMDRLARRLHERGVSLRPHLKTCKNIEIARRCMESPSGPATVSTLAEAEYFAAGGAAMTSATPSASPPTNWSAWPNCAGAAST